MVEVGTTSSSPKSTSFAAKTTRPAAPRAELEYCVNEPPKSPSDRHVCASALTHTRPVCSVKSSPIVEPTATYPESVEYTSFTTALSNELSLVLLSDQLTP